MDGDGGGRVPRNRLSQVFLYSPIGTRWGGVAYPDPVTGQPPRRRSRIGDELENLHREEPTPGSDDPTAAPGKRSVPGRVKDFFKDQLVRSTSTKGRTR